MDEISLMLAWQANTYVLTLVSIWEFLHLWELILRQRFLHLLKTGHNTNFDYFRILFKSHDQSTLPIWEHIYIKKHRPNLTLRSGLN